jgi:hypothetical protein
MRLNKADFPTFGLPTMAINPDTRKGWSTFGGAESEKVRRLTLQEENSLHDFAP